jgi:hypothetical protein
VLGVGVHAKEAVVRGGQRRGQHLALGAGQRRARVVVDEDRVGETAEMDAELRREPHRDADARHVRQPTDDRLLQRPRDPRLLQPLRRQPFELVGHGVEYAAHPFVSLAPMSAVPR